MRGGNGRRVRCRAATDFLAPLLLRRAARRRHQLSTLTLPSSSSDWAALAAAVAYYGGRGRLLGGLFLRIGRGGRGSRRRPLPQTAAGGLEADAGTTGSAPCPLRRAVPLEPLYH